MRDTNIQYAQAGSNQYKFHPAWALSQTMDNWKLKSKVFDGHHFNVFVIVQAGDNNP